MIYCMVELPSGVKRKMLLDDSMAKLGNMIIITRRDSTQLGKVIKIYK